MPQTDLIRERSELRQIILDEVQFLSVLEADGVDDEV